jgi:hypothetical protein
MSSAPVQPYTLERRLILAMMAAEKSEMASESQTVVS